MCAASRRANVEQTHPTEDEPELLAQIQADWLREGLSTTPAERDKTQWAALSTFIGFALEEPLKPKLTKLIDDAVAVNVTAAQQIHEDIGSSSATAGGWATERGLV